jgi:hypothetical protein
MVSCNEPLWYVMLQQANVMVSCLMLREDGIMEVSA